ncbi:MAG: tyrosine-type recombinase/integrase [Bdellovibrionales bacterium]
MSHTCYLEKNPEYQLVYPSGKPLNLVNWFLTAIKTRGLSDKTARAYAFDLLVFYRWWFENKSKKSIKKLNTFDLQSWITYQRELGAKPASINRRLSTVESFYKFSFGKEIHRSNRVAYAQPKYRKRGRRKLGILTVRRQNPLTPSVRVKMPKPLLNPLEAEEIHKIFKVLKTYRDEVIVLLMLLCGLRSSEVITLKTADIDFTRKRIRVWGKGGKERILPLPDRLIYSMKKYMSLERPDISTSEYFLVVMHAGTRGERMTISGLRTIFRHWRLKTGLKKANPHNFRHSFGTNMARHGVSLPVLQRMMGHAEFKHTLRYINLAMTDVAREYAQALSKIEEKYERAVIT